MRHIPRYLLILAAVLSLANILPWLYGIAAGQRVSSPYMLYSPVINDFVYMISDKSIKLHYMGVDGREYTKDEYARLLPFNYARDLVAKGEYPPEIGGVAVPVEVAYRERDSRLVRPVNIDAEKVRVPLYTMFESESGFSGVEIPPDMFRITSRMEFITAETNSLNMEKSELFTSALAEAGFSFPPGIIAGNPDTRKQQDYGYFVTDANGALFHIRMAQGLPVVRNTGAKPDGKIIYINVKEDPNLNYYAIMVTDTGNAYRVMKRGYRLAPVHMGEYLPGNDVFMYSLDPLNIVTRVSNEFGQDIYVSDRRNEPVATYRVNYERRIRGTFRTVYDMLFPFVITVDANTTGRYMTPRLSEQPGMAILLSALLAAAFAGVRIKRGNRKLLPADTLVVLLSGIYGLIAVLLLNGFKRDKKRA